MDLLGWHKPRRTVLVPKIEQLPDDHQFKPGCLLELGSLFDYIGDPVEGKRLIDHALQLERGRGNDYQVALSLITLSCASRQMGLCKEGIDQAKKALEIFERISDIGKQGYSLVMLAYLFHDDGQLDAAEEVASRAIRLLPEKEEFLLCRSHRALGDIYRSKEKTEKAVHHFEMARRIASRFDWTFELFWIHYSLARLFCNEYKLSDAHVHIERAKSRAVNSTYSLGRAVELQAGIYYRQHRLEDATSEALRALEIFEKLGASGEAKSCRALLRDIEEKAKSRDTLMVSFRE